VWNSLAANIDLGVPSQLVFIVPNPPSTISRRSALTLVLLWTSAQEGIPDASNAWALTNISCKYYLCSLVSFTELYITDNCLQSGTLCLLVEGTSGVAQLDLAYNPIQDIPGSTQGGEAILNFFLCFATGVDLGLETLTCESYSTFFNINIPSNNASDRVNRARAFERRINQTNSLFATPTGVLVITQSTAFLTTTSVTFPNAATSHRAYNWCRSRNRDCSIHRRLSYHYCRIYIFSS